jgi:hypothetical protein
MTYHSRIRADPEYLQALGRAVYNFTYFEWGVVWTIVKLSSDGFGSVPKGRTALEIAKALTSAIEKTDPPLSSPLRRQLVKIDESYRAAIKRRNKLFHAHPYTAKDGKQQLGGGGVEWPMGEVDAAAKLFEDAAIACNATFHGALKKERP